MCEASRCLKFNSLIQQLWRLFIRLQAEDKQTSLSVYGNALYMHVCVCECVCAQPVPAVVRHGHMVACVQSYECSHVFARPCVRLQLARLQHMKSWKFIYREQQRRGIKHTISLTCTSGLRPRLMSVLTSAAWTFSQKSLCIRFIKHYKGTLERTCSR